MKLVKKYQKEFERLKKDYLESQKEKKRYFEIRRIIYSNFTKNGFNRNRRGPGVKNLSKISYPIYKFLYR